MNCQAARELFDLRVDGALEAATAERLDEHVRRCSSCQAAYDAVKAESELLSQALQADLSSAAEIGRIEARVGDRILPVSAPFGSLVEWAIPLLSTLPGLLILIWGQFDAAAVRQAIGLSLNPPGGLPVAIPSVLVAGLVILALIMIQSLIFRTGEQN